MSSKILLLVVVITLLQVCAAAAAVGQTTRKLAELVEDQPLLLTYHKGPLLSTSPIDVHLIWYGKFSAVQRTIVGDYLQSLGAKLQGTAKQPSVSSWWKTIEKYEGNGNGNGNAGSNGIAIARLGKQKMDETYSLGKSLKMADIAALVESAIKSRVLPVKDNNNNNNNNAVYLVLTSEDVTVEKFCLGSCGHHASMSMSGASASRADVDVSYAWVGNSETQCPGQCAWPFHQPMYGPQSPPLVAPNGDVGIDGMIINIATAIAGAVTNPFNTGYFQGDKEAPLEAVSACSGIFGKGAYQGFPGELLVDSTTGASYNAYGLNGRRFLVPAMWDPVTKSCNTLV